MISVGLAITSVASVAGALSALPPSTSTTVNNIPGDGVQINVDPSLPSADDFTVTINDTDYTRTVAEWQGVPLVLESPEISADGANPGAVITFDQGGLFTTSTGTLDVTYDLLRDGTVVVADMAVDDTYVTGQAGSFTLRVTLDDGTNPAVIVQTAAIAITAPPAANITLTEIGTTRSVAATNGDNIVETIDFGEAVPGKTVIIMLSYGLAGGGSGVNVTFGGTAATRVREDQPAIQARTGIFSFDVSAGGSLEVILDPQGSWRTYSFKVFTVEGHTSITGTGGGNTSGSNIDLSAAVADGGVILGVSAAAGANDISFTNLTGTFEAPFTGVSGGDKRHEFTQATSSADEARTMEASTSNTGPFAASIAVIS